MTETTNVLAFRQPSVVDDPLTDIVRAGARDLLARAIEVEVGAFLASTANLTLPDGRARLVRHGHGPVREIATGIGPVEVARPKVRDRGASGPGDRLRFSSAILPLWARRTKSLDALIPVLYLRGISTGGFQDALSALLGKDAPNLSPSVIAGLKADWQVEYERWQRRDLSARRYVYIWADGVYLQARMEDHSECMLVLIGTTPKTTLRMLAATIKARWICEQAHQQLKEELGLDHFEGRSWQGLHRHALMTMIAYAFLQHCRLAEAGRKKKNQRSTASAEPAGRTPSHRRSHRSTATSAMPPLQKTNRRKAAA
ncbi:transposase [Bradyrhizobium sp. IC3123]|uniref:transposase n=1 Tax=Bradyrhizobium sp. IC3123 TaxID=2793803 RepID=UPI001CD5FBF0|nr:transposase [Bradyrhizobium sp. IC3123]MCA1394576.1 transposase [Bradyrhizobium sp. IC3123]